jgi:hypothetical protein
MARVGYSLKSSAMSISPDDGHAPYVSWAGYSQKELCSPCVAAFEILARTSKSPSVCVKRC